MPTPIDEEVTRRIAIPKDEEITRRIPVPVDEEVTRRIPVPAEEEVTRRIQRPAEEEPTTKRRPSAAEEEPTTKRRPVPAEEERTTQRRPEDERAAARRGPVQEPEPEWLAQQKKLPPGSVVIDPDPTNPVKALKDYKERIRSTPDREVAIYRNAQTGQFIVVQGNETSAFAAVLKGGKREAPMPGGRKQGWKAVLLGNDVGDWQLVAHFHPVEGGGDTAGMPVACRAAKAATFPHWSMRCMPRAASPVNRGSIICRMASSITRTSVSMRS